MESWVTLQKTIKAIFENAKVQNLSDVLEDDANGWNWILSFDMLENPTALVLHTKFIFKLNEERTAMRRQDFLYLYDLNCVYRWQKFTDMGNLVELVSDILTNSRFGENLLAVSEFMVSPANAINKYFYVNKETDVSVFEVEYKPKGEVVACVKMTLDFQLNINNKEALYLRVRKEEEKDVFELQFAKNEAFEEPQSIEIEKLVDLAATVAQYIKRNYAK